MFGLDSSNIMNDRMLSRKEAANYLGVSEMTLAIWACTKRQVIPMYKIGKFVKYRLSDLQQFVEKNQMNQ